jgi:hypothetical protein
MVKDELAILGPKPEGYVGVQPPPGLPPPLCGALYVSVYPAGWYANHDPNVDCLEETYDVNIVITRRTGSIPKGLFAEQVWKEETLGLEPLARRLITRLLRDRFGLQQAAGLKIEGAGDLVNGPLEALLFAGAVGPTYVGAEWFPSMGQGNDHPVGMTLELKFTGGKRVQDIGGAS